MIIAEMSLTFILFIYKSVAVKIVPELPCVSDMEDSVNGEDYTQRI